MFETGKHCKRNFFQSTNDRDFDVFALMTAPVTYPICPFFVCVCVFFLFVSSLVPHTKNGNMLNYYLDGMTGKRGEKWRKQEEEEGKKHKHS